MPDEKPAEKVHVRFLKTHTVQDTSRKTYVKDQVYAVKPDTAQHFITRGYAEEVEAPAAGGPVTPGDATIPPADPAVRAKALAEVREPHARGNGADSLPLNAAQQPRGEGDQPSPDARAGVVTVEYDKPAPAAKGGKPLPKPLPKPEPKAEVKPEDGEKADDDEPRVEVVKPAPAPAAKK